MLRHLSDVSADFNTCLSNCALIRRLVLKHQSAVISFLGRWGGGGGGCVGLLLLLLLEEVKNQLFEGSSKWPMAADSRALEDPHYVQERAD